MKDSKENEIKIGDEVICLNPIEGFISSTKIYKVLGLVKESQRIIINPDERGLEGHYRSDRFLVLKTGESDIF